VFLAGNSIVREPPVEKGCRYFGEFSQNAYKNKRNRGFVALARTMSAPGPKKMCHDTTDGKRKAVGDAKPPAKTMVVLLNDGTEGPSEISTYYIKIVVGPGLTKSVYKTFENHLKEKKQYFESVTSEAFCGLLDEDDERLDQLVDDFTLFLETHMIPANRLGNGLLTMPDMSLVKFVVNYTSD